MSKQESSPRALQPLPDSVVTTTTFSPIRIKTNEDKTHDGGCFGFRESCLTPASPESCGLVQSFLSESPGQAFVGHVQVQMKTGLQTQDRHLFLFTDTLIVAKTKSVLTSYATARLYPSPPLPPTLTYFLTPCSNGIQPYMLMPHLLASIPF